MDLLLVLIICIVLFGGGFGYYGFGVSGLGGAILLALLIYVVVSLVRGRRL